MQITKDTPENEVLKIGSDCSKCGHCCSFGGGYVIETDIKKMADHFNVTVDEFKEKYLVEHEKFNTKNYRLKSNKIIGKTYGPCIFLGKDKLCTIHGVKPLHCRVGNCGPHGEELSIWYTLNHFVNPDDPESMRQWEIYLKTHKTIPGGELENLVPDEKDREKILSFETLR